MLFAGKICAVVAAPDPCLMWRQLLEAIRATRIVELRLDWLPDDAAIREFLSLLARKRFHSDWIATCRRKEAGGRYRGTIAQQLVHLAEAIRAGCDWYDLEIESAAKCPEELLEVLLGEGKQITSAHFFRRFPRNATRILQTLSHRRTDAIKIAAQCDSHADALGLLRLARGHRDTILVPMGDIALPARILALREGAALAYAPTEMATAPGQIPLRDLKRLYRADRITRQTRVYGVIGNPIAHSLSPQMQNAAFQARRVDAVYLPFLVRDLKDFLRVVRPLGIAGFSVTLPYKEKILRHLDDSDPLAGRIGAVNTVVIRGGGKLYGYNTDYVGLLQAVERKIPLRGSRILIFGAGGVARAIAFALGEAGASVCVCARRPERARALALAAGGHAIPRAGLRDEFFDAIVNATPVGMCPFVGRSPLEARELNCRLVFDTIYRPRVTKLMQLAARRGIETVSGVEMLVAQGAAQWEIWTGERAPEGVMRRALLRALKDEEKLQSQR